MLLLARVRRGRIEGWGVRIEIVGGGEREREGGEGRERNCR